MTADLDLGGLRAALDAVPPGSWSRPSTFRETGVHHGYRRAVLWSFGNPLPAAEPFAVVLEPLFPIRDAWLSWIDAGGFIVPHRDGAPWWERWQVPISTSGVLDGEQATDGVPFRVQHWREHSVWNPGPGPRVHVVVDRDVRLDIPPLPFETFPIPSEYADMVEAVR